LLARDAAALTEAVERSCRNKAEVVAADERESGQRALLNLGIPSATPSRPGRLRQLAARRGGGGGHGHGGRTVAAPGLDRPPRRRIRRLLARFGLPVEPPRPFRPSAGWKLMAVDKKVLDGSCGWCCCADIGDAVVTADFRPEQLRAMRRTDSICGLRKGPAHAVER
jgi:3-dehydroquinate synthase